MNYPKADFSDMKQAFTMFRIGQRKHNEAEARAG